MERISNKSFLECERSKIEKILKYQLSYTWKKGGLLLFAIAFISLFVNKFLVDSEFIREVCKSTMLIGLLIVSISKDRVEDELVIKLRMQSYAIAFIVAVIYSMVLPFVGYLIDLIVKPQVNGIDGFDDFVILWMLLSMQVLFFWVLKRVHFEK